MYNVFIKNETDNYSELIGSADTLQQARALVADAAGLISANDQLAITLEQEEEVPVDGYGKTVTLNRELSRTGATSSVYPPEGTRGDLEPGMTSSGIEEKRLRSRKRAVRESYHSMIADVLLDIEAGLLSATEAMAMLRQNGFDIDVDSQYTDAAVAAEDEYYGDTFDDFPDEFEGPDPIVESTLGSVYDVLAQVETGECTSADALQMLNDEGFETSVSAPLDTRTGDAVDAYSADTYDDMPRYFERRRRRVSESEQEQQAAIADARSLVKSGALTAEEALANLEERFGFVDEGTRRQLMKTGSERYFKQYSRDSQRRFGRFNDGLD